jgi:hypothetical protein
MKVFSIQQDVVTCSDTKYKYGNIAGHWTLSDFESQFGHEFPNGLAYLHYEPERNIYTIGTSLDELTNLPDVETDPHIKWVHDNFDTIMFEATATQLGEDYTYDSDNDTWAITPEKQALKEKAQRQSTRLQVLSEGLKDEFKLIIAFFEVGKSKNLWTDNDFDAGLRTKIDEWKQAIADHDAEENA